MPGAAFCPICNEPLQQSPTIPPQGFPNDPNAVYGQQPGYSQQPPVNGMPGGYNGESNGSNGMSDSIVEDVPRQ